MKQFFQRVDSILVRATAEQAYQFLTNWHYRKQWDEAWALDWNGADQAFTGQQICFKGFKFFIPVQWTIKITGLEKPTRIYFEYIDGPLRGSAAMECVQASEFQCEIKFHWTKVRPYGWINRIIFNLGIGEWLHLGGVQKTFKKFKCFLEKA
jgi:hypothetical protein